MKTGLYAINMNSLIESLEKRGVHELAQLFSFNSKKKLEELSEHIKEHGQQETIKLLDDKIIDGRHRYMACLHAGIEPNFETIETDNPLDYLIGANLQRRQLNTQQRAWTAAGLHIKKKMTIPAVAKFMNTSERNVSSAIYVKKNGSDKLQNAVHRGNVAVYKAEKISTLPHTKQDKLLSLPKNEMGEALRVAVGATKSKDDGKKRLKEVTLKFSLHEYAKIKRNVEDDNMVNVEEFLRDVIIGHIDQSKLFSDKEFRKMVLNDVYNNEPLKFIKKSYTKKQMTTDKELGSSQQERDYINEEEAWDDEFEGGSFEDFLWSHGVEERLVNPHFRVHPRSESVLLSAVWIKGLERKRKSLYPYEPTVQVASIPMNYAA